ncbi:MAG: hypothetical protein H6639_24210, partial [Caldilineaceae bacterium]|nr:hypothetical protein [Caldilineaceae bacterium]
MLVLLCATALLSAPTLLRAQDAPAPIALDEAGFGVAQRDALDPSAQAEFALDLKA